MWIYCSCMGRTKIVSLSYSKSTLVKQQQHFLFPAQKYTCQFFLNFTLQVTNFILITASAKTLVHKKKKEYTFLLFFILQFIQSHTLLQRVCLSLSLKNRQSHLLAFLCVWRLLLLFGGFWCCFRTKIELYFFTNERITYHTAAPDAAHRHSCHCHSVWFSVFEQKKKLFL